MFHECDAELRPLCSRLQDKEDEKSGSSDDDEDETSEEEKTDSEEEEGARLKPVFVRKKVNRDTPGK